jgi:hypothetical protein
MKTQVWKKFSHYKIEVDERQDDKAVEILLCSFARPHMRYARWLACLPLARAGRVGLLT